MICSKHVTSKVKGMRSKDQRTLAQWACGVSGLIFFRIGNAKKYMVVGWGIQGTL